VPLVLRHPSLPRGRRISGYSLHHDLVPTLLEILEIPSNIPFDGRSLLPLIRGERPTNWSEFYITECTWMRKHGWRTPQWKLMVALEPDFHFKPRVELYSLIEDPNEDRNLADEEPEIAAALMARMEAWIARRQKGTGNQNPMETNLNWHGSKEHQGPFTSSQQAYDTLHIGDPGAAARLQNKDANAGGS